MNLMIHYYEFLDKMIIIITFYNIKSMSVNYYAINVLHARLLLIYFVFYSYIFQKFKYNIP